MSSLYPLIALLTGYLLGSIPSGYLAGRWWMGIDIRQQGSGSTGATNVLRVVGKGPALVVFLLDVGKGAAAVLLAAGTKGKRLALPHSRVLLHQPYGQVGYSQVTDLEIAAREILRMRELLEQILATHTGQSIARIHEDTDRDFVMEADAAKEYGVIDEIITTRGAVDRTGPIR